MTGILTSGYDIMVEVERDSAGLIEQGMILGDILSQNQATILSMHRGDYKEDPSVGVGITDITLDHDLQTWKRTIQEQMELDGQKVSSIVLTTTGLTIDASY